MTKENAMKALPQLDDPTLEIWTRHADPEIRAAAEAELQLREVAGKPVVHPPDPALDNLCHMALVDLAEDLEELHEKLRKRIERDADNLARKWIPAFRFMQSSIARNVLNDELARLRRFQNAALENKIQGAMIAEDFSYQLRLLDPGPETEDDTLGEEDEEPELVPA